MDQKRYYRDQAKQDYGSQSREGKNIQQKQNIGKPQMNEQLNKYKRQRQSNKVSPEGFPILEKTPFDPDIQIEDIKYAKDKKLS